MHLSGSWLLFGQVTEDLRACSMFKAGIPKVKVLICNWEAQVNPKGPHNWLPFSQGPNKPSKWFKCMSEEPSSLICGIALPTYMWGFRGSNSPSVKRPSTWMAREERMKLGMCKWATGPGLTSDLSPFSGDLMSLMVCESGFLQVLF